MTEKLDDGELHLPQSKTLKECITECFPDIREETFTEIAEVCKTHSTVACIIVYNAEDDSADSPVKYSHAIVSGAFVNPITLERLKGVYNETMEFGRNVLEGGDVEPSLQTITTYALSTLALSVTDEDVTKDVVTYITEQLVSLVSGSPFPAFSSPAVPIVVVFRANRLTRNGEILHRITRHGVFGSRDSITSAGQTIQ